MPGVYPDMAAVELALLARLHINQRLKDWQTLIVPLPVFNLDGRAKLFAKYPAVGTYCGRATYSTDYVGRACNEQATLSIFCGGDNYRDPAGARAGDDEQVGVMQLIEACRLVVEGWGGDANIQEMVPTGWEMVWTNNQIAVGALTVNVKLTRPIVPTEGELKDHGSV